MLNNISKRLKENITTYYPHIDRKSVSITGIPIGGPYAQTFKFTVTSDTSSPIDIFVKICPIYERLNPAVQEYRTLKLLYDQLPKVSTDFAVSRPLDFFDDINAYAMESVGNLNLRTYLLKNNSRIHKTKSDGELLSYISKSAQWLRAFHDITKSTNVMPFDSKKFLQSINDDFSIGQLANFSFKKPTIDDLQRVIKQLSKLDGRLFLPCAKCHWDYTPGHVFIDNGKISVIDILGLDNIPIYEDIGHFMAAMTSVNNLPFYPFFDFRRAKGMLCDRFMESYYSGIGYEIKSFMLLSNIYRLKYLILYFGGQYKRVSQKTHPLAGRAFANLRLVRLFNEPILHTIDEIAKRMRNLL